MAGLWGPRVGEQNVARAAVAEALLDLDGWRSQVSDDAVAGHEGVHQVYGRTVVSKEAAPHGTVPRNDPSRKGKGPNVGVGDQHGGAVESPLQGIDGRQGENEIPQCAPSNNCETGGGFGSDSLVLLRYRGPSPNLKGL